MPNVYKSCPKNISLVKFTILSPLQKLPKNVRYLGKINCYQRLWKVAQSPINRPIWSHRPQASRPWRRIFLVRLMYWGPPYQYSVYDGWNVGKERYGINWRKCGVREEGALGRKVGMSFVPNHCFLVPRLFPGLDCIST